MSTHRPVVAVVGAGVSGLRAARLLKEAGADVVVHEASTRLGGQIETVDVAGTPIDVGAEAMHLGAPGVAPMLESLGLTDTMVRSRPGSSWLYGPRGLKPLPAGVGPAGPTRLRPVLESRIMTVPGLARAGLEPLLARRQGRLDLGTGHDVSVGEFVASRFGREVVDRFVDPLLGSLHAGDVSRLSLRAAAPSLVPAATQGRSLVVRRRKPAAGPARGGNSSTMSFVNWPGGLVTVVDALADGLDVRTGSPVTAIDVVDGRYRVTTGGPHPDTAEVDAVVLAVSAGVAASLLHTVSPVAQDKLTDAERADVATIVVAYPRHVVDALPAFRGTGVLVPSSTGSLLKAATFLTTKWPHLDRPDLFFCRLSVGRAGDTRLQNLDDDALLTRVRGDLKRFIGLDVAPTHTHVRRWPDTMPQLLVGHHDRLDQARAALPPGLTLAGSSYDGVGITACLASAARAADATATHLGLTRGDTPA